MGNLKMKIFNKYFKIIRDALTICCLILFGNLAAAGIDENQTQKLGNFLDNAFANMNDEEKDMFMQEVQREQDKLMKMTPEERAAREEQVAKELDQLMNNSPYGEWFEKPTTLPEQPEQVEEKKQTPKDDSTTVKKTASTKAKPKNVAIPKDLKLQSKQLVQNIVQAIDSILLKTSNMQDIQHASWNKGKWSDLKSTLQSLKSQLLMIVNSDKILADFIGNEHKSLRANLQEFEKTITHKALQLKTPDSMGLVVTFEGQSKIVDQARYDAAVLSLRGIIDILSDKIANHHLVAKIKKLVDNDISSKSNDYTIDAKNLITNKSAKTKEASAPACQPNLDTTAALNQIKLLAQEVKRCANEQLLDLVMQYKASPTALLKRKLQWKLSELELHLGKLARTIESIVSCQNEIDAALDKTVDNYKTFHKIVSLLNEAERAEEISALLKQISTHSATIKF